MALSSGERRGKVRPSGVPTSTSKASSAGNIGFTPGAIFKLSLIFGGNVVPPPSRKAFGPRGGEKKKGGAPNEPGKADEGLSSFFPRHALDRVATDGLDGADPFHADPPIPPASALTPLYARKRNTARVPRAATPPPRCR